MKQRPKIFIGINETANSIYDFARTLSMAGYTVETAARKNPFYLSNQYTFVFAAPNWLDFRLIRGVYLILLSAYYFLKLAGRYEIYVFVSSMKTFLPLNLDILLLRLIGKRVIVFNCGSDVRYRPIHVQMDKLVFGISEFVHGAKEYRNNTIPFWRSLWNHKLQEMTSCDIVSMRNQATFQKKDYIVFRFPTTSQITRPKPAELIPLIIHAPSNRVIKGTQHVLDAIENLKAEGLKFNFELIENRDNAYVLSRLLKADIVIDQPGTWIAKLASEGLAASCVVIGGNNYLYEGMSMPSPVIPFERDTLLLQEKLRDLILNSDLRQEIMNASYAYWAENYSPDAFIRYFESILSKTAPQLKPIPHHKDVLLRAASPFQRFIIRLFY